jgi:hypothetical protein
MIYLLTMRDWTQKKVTALDVGIRLRDVGFTRLGGNFQSRLEQLKFIEPDVIDWEMIEE